MKKISLFLFIVVFSSVPIFGQWQMFGDKEDTYIYNTITGEIYVRFKKKGKNYEDVFVKMPQGIVLKKEVQGSILSPQDTKTQDASLETLRLQSIKKAQEMLKNSINSVTEENH